MSNQLSPAAQKAQAQVQPVLWLFQILFTLLCLYGAVRHHLDLVVFLVCGMWMMAMGYVAWTTRRGAILKKLTELDEAVYQEILAQELRWTALWSGLARHSLGILLILAAVRCLIKVWK